MTHLEVPGDNLELLPWQRNALDDSVCLPFERDDRLVEHNTLVLFGEHAH